VSPLRLRRPLYLVAGSFLVFTRGPERRVEDSSVFDGCLSVGKKDVYKIEKPR